MSALILICKTEQRTETVRFAFEDGRMNEAIELLATYLVELGVPESVHEAVSAERLGIVLRQNAEIKELRQWAMIAGWCPPAREAAI